MGGGVFECTTIVINNGRQRMVTLERLYGSSLRNRMILPFNFPGSETPDRKRLSVSK